MPTSAGEVPGIVGPMANKVDTEKSANQTMINDFTAPPRIFEEIDIPMDGVVKARPVPCAEKVY